MDVRHIIILANEHRARANPEQAQGSDAANQRIAELERQIAVLQQELADRSCASVRTNDANKRTRKGK